MIKITIEHLVWTVNDKIHHVGGSLMSGRAGENHQKYTIWIGLLEAFEEWISRLKIIKYIHLGRSLELLKCRRAIENHKKHLDQQSLMLNLTNITWFRS